MEDALALPAGMSMYAQSEEGAGASTMAASLAGVGGEMLDMGSGLEDSWSSQAGQGTLTASVQPRSQQPFRQHAAGTPVSYILHAVLAVVPHVQNSLGLLLELLNFRSCICQPAVAPAESCLN